MDKNIYRFFVLMNEQGVAVSDMNNDMKALIDSGVLTYSQALPFLTNLRTVGTNQQALIKWAEPTDVPPPDDIPGPVIGDVGDMVNGRGPVSLSDMSYGNWRFYQQNSLAAKWTKVFSGTLEQLNAAIGSLPGNLTTTPEDPITKSGIDLRSF